MSSPTNSADAVQKSSIKVSSDDDHLRALGYEPKLDRKMGFWSNFALGFIYLSPMVGVVSIFGLGLTSAGPASIFWILIVGVGQLLVALVFGEVVSQFPLAGGLYQWARRLWSGSYAWLMSWIYTAGITIGITTTALFSADFVASLFLGTPEEPSVSASPLQKSFIAIVVLVICLLFNLTGTRTLARISKIGLFAELAGVILLGLYLLIFQRKNDLSILFDTMGTVSENGMVAAFLGASLVGLYMLYGFESCGEIAEETPNPARMIPRTMALTVIVGGGSAFLAFAGYVLAAPNLQSIVSGETTNPIPNILQDTLGTFGSKVFIVVALTSFLAGVMGQQTAVSRLVYSFARDDMFPGARHLAKVKKSSHVPVNALLAVNVVPVLLIVFVLFFPDSLFRIAAFQVVAVYFSFQMVVFAALRARSKGWKPAGPWNLGRWGALVNVAALVYGVAAIVVLSMPSGDESLAFTDRWIALIGFLTVVAVGTVYMLVAKPHRKSTAPEGDAIEVARLLSQSK
ncbi:amino acid permease [Pseudarthrobacter sp. R1]|uniref:APC family permease n=1 Tax=Pseudarthrobacter sp. R1 TaxID=2944934 RepID=UPI00210CBB81|nr:amino acid permease [Pseudarthrobacter sp. R1]MCQ6272759.1 amino acid permease [Pseudarthrobacter sp. R1]